MAALPPRLTRVLEARRSRFNAAFAQARRLYPRLDADPFMRHLRVVVAPILEALPEKGNHEAVGEVLYDVCLDLLGRDLFSTEMQQAWLRLLTAHATYLAADPHRVTASISNAVHQLENARPETFIATLENLAVPDLASLLAAGAVAAWRAGLPHYRKAALDSARTLPPALARRALGLPQDGACDRLLDRLEADPWLSPEEADAPAPAQRQLHIVARVGDFRGLGGEFRRPPTAHAAGPDLYVSDGTDTWLLTADCFGATLHRAAPHPQPADPALRLERDGTVTARGCSARFPVLADARSHASNRTTLVVCPPRSHRVLLVALR